MFIQSPTIDISFSKPFLWAFSSDGYKKEIQQIIRKHSIWSVRLLTGGLGGSIQILMIEWQGEIYNVLSAHRVAELWSYGSFRDLMR